MQTTISVWEACLLGVVQGLTEFLPVSSDGHLAMVQYFLAPMPAEEKLAVDVALHFGTLVAVILYFRGELLEMAAALVGRSTVPYARRWIWLLALATLPAAVAGLPLKSLIESTYDSLVVIGLSFIATGTFLFFASAVRGAHRTETELGPVDAVMIGSFQVLALLPGLSRSGTTISAALFRRTRPDVAAKFSFLLAIPAILGAEVVEARSIFGLAPAARVPVAIGVVVAGLVGFFAIAALLRVVRGGKLHWFAYYCWALGLAVLIGAAVGALG
ncbi:MAG TPA: undecaprenyl-diphosphate phosphatase [Candidatus Binatia bacterium]|nr:undecaprenyl-diphosphate phosphatase [Candidatus Binatia bacterium]